MYSLNEQSCIQMRLKVILGQQTSKSGHQGSMISHDWNHHKPDSLKINKCSSPKPHCNILHCVILRLYLSVYHWQSFLLSSSCTSISVSHWLTYSSFKLMWSLRPCGSFHPLSYPSLDNRHIHIVPSQLNAMPLQYLIFMHCTCEWTLDTFDRKFLSSYIWLLWKEKGIFIQHRVCWNFGPHRSNRN